MKIILTKKMVISEAETILREEGLSDKAIKGFVTRFEKVIDDRINFNSFMDLNTEKLLCIPHIGARVIDIINKLKDRFYFKNQAEEALTSKEAMFAQWRKEFQDEFGEEIASYKKQIEDLKKQLHELRYVPYQTIIAMYAFISVRNCEKDTDKAIDFLKWKEAEDILCHKI